MKQSIFAWSAVALIASSALVGCVVEEDSNVDNTDGGVAGKGSGGNGATGGTAGTGGSSTAGTGGATGGTGATGGSAGATGGTAGTTTGGTGGTTGGTGGTGGAVCLDDTATTTPDCANLAYAATQCDDNGNTVSAYGNVVCAYTKLYGRPGVFESVYNCLDAISGDACSASHDTAADACYGAAFGNACELQFQDATCADYEAGCAGLQTTCEAVINGYTLDAQEKIAYCFNAGTGNCTDDFNACLADPTTNDAN
ncbi:MAG: hypothetical protein H6718_28065 [Polyangiaceae bacterium]|nr:hypothetical protein [Polyangiaceae bacterium]